MGRVNCFYFSNIMPWLNDAFKRKGRDLYKQFLFLSKVYPGDGIKIMQRVRTEYYSYEHCTDEAEIKQAFNRAKWHIKELEGTTQFAKYRFLKKNYEFSSPPDSNNK